MLLAKSQPGHQSCRYRTPPACAAGSAASALLTLPASYRPGLSRLPCAQRACRWTRAAAALASDLDPVSYHEECAAHHLRAASKHKRARVARREARQARQEAREASAEAAAFAAGSSAGVLPA